MNNAPPRELMQLLSMPKAKGHKIPYGVTDTKGNSTCPKCSLPVASTGRGGWKHV